MEDLTWLEVTLETTTAELDTVTAILTANGSLGFSIEEEEDFKKFLEENRQYWDYVDDQLMERMKGAARVKFYVTDDADGMAQLAQMTAGLEHVPTTTAKLKEQDWATSWQKYYKPMPVGDRLYIVPEWEKEEGSLPEGRVALYLNPGLTFGTGSHASTRLCLEGVEAYTAQGGKVLDLGCGSGILSIAGLLLGAETAIAVDIDPKAVGVAYENAEMNGIGKDRYYVQAGNVLDDQALVDALSQHRYQLVLANIVADVIIPLSAQVPHWLEEGGYFICSGIIDTRCEEVAEAIRGNGFTILNKLEQDGWVAYVAVMS